MGFPSKLAVVLLFAVLATATGILSAQPELPENLPKPPPIPPEILQRKPPEPPPDLPDPSELMEQLRQLEELLSMSPEKLRKLRETIEIIENKSVAERETMRIRLRQVTQMTSELRQEIDGFRALVPGLSRSDLTQFWLALEEAERETIRQRLDKLSQEQQAAFLEKEVQAFIDRRDRLFQNMSRSVGTGPKQPDG